MAVSNKTDGKVSRKEGLLIWENLPSTVRKRNIGVCIFLSIITFGLYKIYWDYLLVKNVRAVDKDYSNCTGEVLCLVFIPFYNIYWWFTRGRLVSERFAEHGFKTAGNKILLMLMAIFGLDIVSMSIMQHDFNSLSTEPVIILKKSAQSSYNTMRKDPKRNWFIFSLLIVPLLHFLVFWLYINAKTISLTFMQWDVFENAYKFVGFDNIIDQFRSFHDRPETMNMFLNAFRAIPINLACMVLAVIIGYAFSKHIFGENVFRVIFYLPSMISIVILTLCYRYMFTYNEGMLVGPAAEMLRMLGINYQGWAPSVDDPSVINQLWWLVSIFCVWASAGINIILMSSAMSRIPEEVIESAKLDGVGFWRELFQIQIPLIMPTISVFIINSMMAVSAFYVQPMLILGETGPRSAYNTVGWYMFNMTPVEQNYDMPQISTVGFILNISVSFLVIITRIITDKLTPEVDF